jgi:sugar/nucleoside kinase (ribokinase family)
VVLCTLGDLLLDVVVRLGQPLAPGDDATAETRLCAGGQAANVAAWAAVLGAQARFVGKRGDDEVGALAAGALARLGVDVLGPVVPGGRNGVVVSMVEPGGARTMASDRRVAPDLAAEELEPAWFEGCDHLHVAGYSLLRDPIAGAALEAARLARAEGATVSVDLSSWSRIRDLGPEAFRARLAALAPDLVFANEAERDALGELDGTPLVLKRGANGIVADGREWPAAPAEAVDTTGAGDALAAGYLVGGPEVGLRTAARCVSQLGAMP